MKVIDFVLLGIIFFTVAFVISYLIKNKNKCSGCGCNCEGCSKKK